ncbi:MAG: ATP-binding protein [Candidatus Eiseniibacteriota bacterium]|jgi:signal transduction histidine kinase
MDRRSVFLGLRWVAITALGLHVAYNRGEALWSDVRVWTVLMALVLSNLVLTVVRPSAFQRHRLYFYTFLLDLVLVSIAVYMAEAQNIGFFVMLLLCILSGAISGNIKSSFLFSTLASAIYLGQLRVELTGLGQMLDPTTLLRAPLLVVFALTASSLSNRADRRESERAALLVELDRRLQAQRPLGEIAATLTELLRERLKCAQAAFYLEGSRPNTLRRVGGTGLPALLHRDQMPPGVRERLDRDEVTMPHHLRGSGSWCRALGVRPGATFVVPAHYSSRPQGIIIVEFRRRVLDGEKLAGFLGQLADRTAGSMFNARLLQNAQESAIGLHSLLKMSEAVASSLSTARILSLLEESCRRLMKVRVAKVFLVRPATRQSGTTTAPVAAGTTPRETAHGAPGKLTIAGIEDARRLVPVSGEATALETAAAREAWRTGEPVVLANEDEIAKLGGQAAADETVNLVAMPLRTPDGVVGVVEALDKPDPFSARDLALLGGLAGQTAVALEKARLYAHTRERAARIERLARGIEQEKHKLEHVLANMDEGVLLLEERGVALLNHAGRRLLAPLGPCELPAAREQFADRLELLARLGKVLDGDPPGQEIIADGDRFLMLHSVRLAADSATDDDEEAGKAVIAVIRDITEIVRLGERRSEFVSQVSHELRTPLSAVVGAVKLLGEGRAGQLSDNQSRLVAIMDKESQHLLELINDLLDIAKLEAGSMVIEKQSVDLAALLADAAEALRGLAADKSIALEVDVDDLPDPAHCDPLRIRQVVLNLLGNAIKFTPAGGHVRLDALREADQFLIRVTDDGPGIPVEKRELIFDKFEQLGGGESRARGTGLGLAISRRIVEGHGGTIGVHSEPGRGSTFFIQLPAALHFTATVEEEASAA